MAINGFRSKLHEIMKLYDDGMCVQHEIVFTVVPWFDGGHDDEILWSELPLWAKEKIWDEVKDITDISEIIVSRGTESEVRSHLIALRRWIELRGRDFMKISRSLPVVHPSPELIEAITHSTTAKTIEKSSILIRSQIKKYLWEEASYFHADVIGRLLYLATFKLDKKGMLSNDVLERAWNEGFESSVVDSQPLDVVGAQAFLFQLLHTENMTKEIIVGAEKLSKHLHKQHPVSSSGVLDMNDINWQ